MNNNLDKELVDFFGKRWKTFKQNFIEKDLKTIFDKYFSIFPWSLIGNDSSGIDIGSGSGRWAQFVLPKVKKLYCLDPSIEAIEVSRNNLKQFKNCEFINSGISEIKSLPNHSLDFAYSLGVLHHIPDTNKAMHSIGLKLKDGAPFLLYLYYDLENRKLYYKFMFFITNILRFFISKLPFSIKIIITDFIALFFYWPFSRIAKILNFFSINSSYIPLSFYKDLSFYTLRSDSLDRFGTRLEKRFSRKKIIDLMEKNGFEKIQFRDSEPYWTAIGYFNINKFLQQKFKIKEKKVLIICPFPKGVMASQRLKYEQHLGFLESKNYSFKIESFIDFSTWEFLYKKGYFILKIKATLKGYFKRLLLIRELKNFDIIYIHMWVTPFGYNFFEKIYRNNSKKIIYDIEDNVFINQKNEINPLTYFFKSNTKINYLIKVSDQIITSAPDLNTFCKEITKTNNCTFITPAINLQRYQPIKFNKSKEILTIGWTGTFSSLKYLKSLEPLLINLSKKYNFKLIVIGNFEYDIDTIDVEVIQWTKENEISDLSKIDIGLYPLIKDDWVSGKSGLKTLQYMAMGIPSISTNIGNVKNIVNHGANGFLVNDISEWYDCILKIYNDYNLRKKISINGRKTVENYFSTKKIDALYLEVFDKL